MAKKKSKPQQEVDDPLAIAKKRQAEWHAREELERRDKRDRRAASGNGRGRSLSKSLSRRFSPRKRPYLRPEDRVGAPAVSAPAVSATASEPVADSVRLAAPGPPAGEGGSFALRLRLRADKAVHNARQPLVEKFCWNELPRLLKDLKESADDGGYRHLYSLPDEYVSAATQIAEHLRRPTLDLGIEVRGGGRVLCIGWGLQH
jgi:hypothetical protein